MYTTQRCKRDGRASAAPRMRAFTLTELLATVAAIGALLLVLVPALQAAGGRDDAAVCLQNLHALGMAVRTYADEYGTLPGPLSPAVSHDITAQTEEYFREQQLSWKLRSVLGSDVGDRLITCPTASALNPDANFVTFFQLTSRDVRPVHYALNNVGPNGSGGPAPGVRTTNPPTYFGLQAPPPSYEVTIAPRRWGQIAQPAEEWMIADAWYRPRTNPSLPELQQEGPLQTSWTGEALPYFAPHGRSAPESYVFTGSSARSAGIVKVRQNKSDGATNTLFFDGHAAGVPSRTLTRSGLELLYGFPGTVNPYTPLPSQAIWR